MNNQDKLFVIAIGGTGMRCLEAFTHLCAIGMFDSREIEVLTLDTDETNGNKDRTENLIRLYNRIKTSGGTKGGTPNSNTFFSAKLNLHRFWTVYSGAGRENYRNISNLDVGEKEDIEDNKLLSSLFLEEAVQDFNLVHGYRAQTHLGSHLMYHGFVEAARNLKEGVDPKTQEKDLGIFLEKLNQAAGSARVFVFGSVFGGTGASSIPVIPKAIDHAIKIINDGKASLDKGAKFGATLLTEYFSFKKPTKVHMKNKDDGVIADSSFFPLNSQAALQFYQSDPTVQTTYKYLYHVGWPMENLDLEKGKKTDKPIVGGAAQRNGCHITELICACGAYDFFEQKEEFSGQKYEVLFKAFNNENNSLNFTFNDFVGVKNDAGKIFANRLGAFFALSHMVLSLYKTNGMNGFLQTLHESNVTDYDTISEEECKDFNEYMRLFLYDFPNEGFRSGWFYQIRNSVKPGKFIFRDESFPEDAKSLSKVDVGALFIDKKYHWEKARLNPFSTRYDYFVSNKLLDQNGKRFEKQKVTTTKEKFLAHIFNAVSLSHNILD